MKRVIIIILVLSMFFLVGCSSSSESSSSTSDPTAEDIVNAFVSAGLPVTNIVVYNEETDRNDLLGRPGEYISKANFDDSRIENDLDEPTHGAIETFKNHKDLLNRVEYLEEVIEAVNLVKNEYMYHSDLVLLRLDYALTPAQAEEYEKVFNSIDTFLVQDAVSISASTSQPSIEPTPTPEPTPEPKLGIGDTINFDDLEITFNGVSVAPIENRFADDDYAVLVDITIINNADENHSLNMFYHNCFGPDGLETDTAGSYFDTAIDWLGDMRPGATMSGHLVYVYKGDGEYVIEFDDWEDQIEVFFDVVK